ncbi:dipeptidase [Planococcus sp. ISL-109]|uniref:dipeptidase n=1 Tax=Planococcus sp. ISL-109 TaxID=2819166 RepID=UPI001BED13CD|nr:dipeptidase [Planococcus sp. ISL-109]
MHIIDTHCDALLKLQVSKRNELFREKPIEYKDAEELDSSFLRLQQGGVKVQFFAIFVHPELPDNEKWQHALEQIDLFYSEVLGQPLMKHIRQWNDIDALKQGEIGAVLSLEGADAFGNDLSKLRHLYRLGMLSLGLTWNYANLCADGALEPRSGGLTLLGKQVVGLNNEHGILTDVSHLSPAGFWDVLEFADYPFASHSNARKLCDHPRNLDDRQIEAMFARGGLIDVVFCPDFIIQDSRPASIDDLLCHIDHMCALGGERHIGLGSDFDGIFDHVAGLENASAYPHLIEALQKRYTETQVEGFAFRNFLEHRPGISQNHPR